MLNRDPERHVGLMPVKYGTQNELAESGPIAEYHLKYEGRNEGIGQASEL